MRHAALLLLLGLSACGSLPWSSSPRSPAPVVDRSKAVGAQKAAPRPRTQVRSDDPRPETYTVQAGDRLYAIALDFGLNYRELASWNGISDPDRIAVGQVLRLRPPAEVATTSALESVDAPRATPVAPAAAGAASALPKETLPQPAVPVEAWLWPARGKLVATFSESANRKGIDIAGRAGDPVQATAPGEVVYASDGLRGYGKLIVIRHNKEMLSAYGHNQRLLVKEGDTVKAGQKIAEMGMTDAPDVRLHFEIRRFGKPVDPLKHLAENVP